IARAVYSDADVYLLDDPLSAVDSHVGRALFEQCIRGPLKDKTVILVTNALHHLPAADNILWLEGGELKAQGTYTELVAKGLDIEELAHMNDSDQEEEEAKGEAAGDEAVSGPPSGKGGERVSLSKPNARRSVDKRASLDKKGVAGKGKVTLTRQETSANRNLTGVEEREAGNLSLDVVTRYFDGGGGWLYVALIVMMFAAEQGARVYTDRWVGVWFSDSYNRSTAFYLGIYFALGVLYGALTFARSLRFLYCCVNAAVSLHNQLLTHILRLPKTFFDTNPAGRILNRFSRDTDIMDNTLSVDLIQFAGCIATLTSSLIVIAIATKWFAIALVPLAIIYLLLQRLYIPSARELQRIESVSRSPIYNRFAEAMLGVATIRAYRKGEHFTAMSDQLMHANANAFMTQKLAATWLALRLDVMGLVILTGCGALVIQGSVSPSIAGLALVYALELTRFLKQATTMGSKTETDFNSVERIVQYLAPEPEPAPDSPPDVMAKLGEAWPSAGAITVKELTMRYRPEMPLVLRGVSFQVAAGQKVGLVGRTGSGKSSMLLALFRMVEKEAGSIIIDGVDVSSLGVRHLRSKMSIIPQDPFMFSGSVRVNLDPFELHTDAQLWEVVNAVGLTAAITELEDKLGAKVVDNGANFSLGQRQLFCMARAMLRNSKILMLDEATASVDLDTDNMIQTAVLVMDSGRVVEDAHPADLLDNEKGIFTGMVNQTGKSSARYLRSVAQAARRGDTSFRAFANQRTGLNFAASASRMAATAAATDAIVAAEDMHVTLDGLGDKQAQLALGHGTQTE
ncbi:ABC transporter, multidrug resistance associated protein, partial [Haematococcus lacustris]